MKHCSIQSLVRPLSKLFIAESLQIYCNIVYSTEKLLCKIKKTFQLRFDGPRNVDEILLDKTEHLN